MEFKKGKKVRVISNRCGHNYDIGSVVEMVSKCSYSGFNAINSDGESWSVYYSDCEEVESKPERYKSREVNGLDVIALVEHWKLNFQEGNILKYLLRDKGEDESDMQKIADYAKRELELIKQRKNK